MQNELWNSLTKDKKIKVLCLYWESRYQKTKIHKTFETLYGKENLENENIETIKNQNTMATILQLKVDGISYEYSNSTRITEITQEEFDELLPLMEAIIEAKKKDRYNFDRSTDLEFDSRQERWVEVYKVKKRYPKFSKEIDKLFKYVPNLIDGIDSFELLRTETLDKLV